METKFSTGLRELDQLIHGLIVGDNVVLQVDEIEDYARFVEPFVRWTVDNGHPLVYFRFARHRPLVTEAMGARVCELDPQVGFEGFLGQIHAVIEEAGVGACYVFDSLSQLAADWFSDQMLGNFFRLTCPYLYDMATIAYFALARNHHSAHALGPIRDTTQLLIDIFHHDGNVYVRPLKVQQRYSPSMQMLHKWNDGAFEPVTYSATISEVLNSTPGSALESAIERLDLWHRTFLRAEESVRRGGDGIPGADHEELRNRLLRMAVSREEPVLELAREYFTIEDILDIGRRTIGTGLIGGKSVGMLLGRGILKRRLPRWSGLLEMHDSFYIASDVFYSYLVRNGCWWLRQSQKNAETFLKGAQQARRRIITGSFPPDIEQQFLDLLDYFGEDPLIVRSSSLLEDSFGNSFAGKYESMFCPNQGSRHQRLENFVAAVKSIYASSISEDALAYRARHGLLDRDEQMALLVQRVSGRRHGHLFYPHIAGVGFSHNLFAWSEHIEPEAGMLRLVFGLGTRAVDRSDDDYTRIVALNAPERAPEPSGGSGDGYAQRRVDVLDLNGNQLVTEDFAKVIEDSPDVPVGVFASADIEAARRARQQGLRHTRTPRVLTFSHLLKETSFVDDMSAMLRTLHDAYGCPVDVEFTANFDEHENYRVNVVQCRPLQMRNDAGVEAVPENVPDSARLVATNGPVIGYSQMTNVERFIYVVPAAYSALPVSQKYSVARLVGKVAHDPGRPRNGATMLLGPGRWGTTTPSLGVTVSFAEIETVNILCEIVEMREDLVPDVSFGTHFFSEMIEMDILYLALFPDKAGSALARDFFLREQNRFTEIVPDAPEFAEVVRVVDMGSTDPGRKARLYADAIHQRVLCYLDRVPSPAVTP